MKHLLILAIVSAAYADDPCSPRLQPMETTRIPVFDTDGNPNGTLQTISVAETETRKLVVDYLTPDRSDVVGQFSMIGEIEASNVSSVRRSIKFRQSVKIDEGMLPVFAADSLLCWDPDKRRIIADFAYTVDAGQTVTNEISWSVTLRLESQVADINSDGWVDGLDQGILLGDWGSTNARSDLNFDGVVNGEDLGILFSQWSESSDDEES